MKRTLLALTLVMCGVTTSQAQIGRLAKEGVEAIGKRAFGRTAKEAVEEGAEAVVKRAGTTTAKEIGDETVKATAIRAGISAAKYTDHVAHAVSIHGGSITAPLVKTFGDDGAKAAVKLSSVNASRMAIIAEDLAATGKGTEWMRVLAAKGDVCADWVWKNKKALAVGTVATAFLANPDAFLQAGESVVNRSVETAGAHVAQPLIQGTVEHVVPKVLETTAQTVIAPVVADRWYLLALIGGVGAVSVVLLRKQLEPWWTLVQQFLRK